MTTLFESKHREEFLLTEAHGSRSRETVLFSTSAIVGQILGQKTDGALTAVAVAKVGNTGNGVFTLANPAVALEAKPGVWKVIINAAAANAGDFQVFDPTGELDGEGKVGVAYAGGIKFTWADGAADFVLEDEEDVTVAEAAPDDSYVPLNLAATDGSQRPAAISAANVVVDGAAEAGVVLLRDCEVMGLSLVYPAGASQPQMTAINTELGELGVIVRYPQGQLISG